MPESENHLSAAVFAAVRTPTVTERPAEEEDVSRLAAGAGIALGGKLAGRGIRLLVDIALARLLGPLSFGLYAIGWTVFRIVTLVTPLGLDAGVIRFGSRDRGRDRAALKGVMIQSLRLALFSGIVMGAGVYFAAPWVGEVIFHKPEVTPVIRCFALAFPLITGLRVAAAATRVSQRMKFSVSAEDMGQPAANLLLIFLFCAWVGGLAGALAACVFSFGIGLVVALRYIKHLFPEIGSPQITPVYPGKALLAFSLPASLTGMFGVLVIWVDRLIVGHFRPAAEVGIYHAASQLSVAFAIILGAFSAIFSPVAADLFHRGEIGRLEELFRVSTKWGLYLSVPPFLVMCFAPRQVMSVLFGAPYALGWSALLILAFGQVVNAGTGPVGLLLVMTGHQNRMFMISGTMFLASVALGITFVPRWGIAGAAGATACALSGLFISAVFLAKRVLGMRPYDRRYVKGVLATLLTVGALTLLGGSGIASPVVRLLSTVIVATGIFGVA